MFLELRRRWLTEKSTIGELWLGDKRLCYILEDTYRGDSPAAKIPGETCIPCGTYEIRIHKSPTFGRDVPMLVDVPGFHHILIHWGNEPKHTKGCLLTGLERAEDSVRLSRAAFDVVWPHIHDARALGELVHIRISLTKEEQRAESD